MLLFMTREGYFKKITPQSWRMSQDHKLKEGDEVVWSIEATNKSEIIFFTSMQQAYKARLYDFDDSKASVLGDYLPAKLGMDEGETPLYAMLPGDYKGQHGRRVPERQGSAVLAPVVRDQDQPPPPERRIFGQVSGRRLLLPGR